MQRQHAACGWLGLGLSSLLVGLGTLAAPGCGGDDSAGNNNASGEHLSPDLLSVEGGTPDYTCVGGADPALSFSADTEISGIVNDFEQDTPVEGIVVAVYSSLQDLLDENPYDVSEPSSPTGSYAVTAPSGVPRLHFKMHDPATEDYYDTIEIMEPVAGMPPGPPQATGKDRIVVSAITMATVPAILGIARQPGTGIVAGRVYDCQRREVQFAAQRAYDAPPDAPSRTLLSVYEGAGRNSFYFGNGMPVRDRVFTDVEGQFIIANVPYTQGEFVTMEMWGRLQSDWLPAGHEDCTEGCLISVQDVPVLPDTVVITDMLPLYAAQ